MLLDGAPAALTGPTGVTAPVARFGRHGDQALHEAIDNCRPAQLPSGVPTAPPVRVYLPPSAEARWLARRFGPLAAPRAGEDQPGWRALRHAMVAPYTQLTLVSFDLQMFLFDVLHPTPTARAGHALGMTTVVLGGLALLGHVGGAPAACLGAVTLFAWYAVVALSTGLRLWAVVMAACLALLTSAALALAARAGVGELLAAVAAAGAVVSLSHAFEVHFPPRAGDPLRWTPMNEYLWGAPGARHAPAFALRRLARVSGYAVLGWVNEIWASPRLLPYNVLRLMFAAGYAPSLRATLDERARRAWASGCPALDFVGEGGGAFLPPDV